jgi:hypothetical protein
MRREASRVSTIFNICTGRHQYRQSRRSGQSGHLKGDWCLDCVSTASGGPTPMAAYRQQQLAPDAPADQTSAPPHNTQLKGTHQ